MITFLMNLLPTKEEETLFGGEKRALKTLGITNAGAKNMVGQRICLLPRYQMVLSQ